MEIGIPKTIEDLAILNTGPKISGDIERVKKISLKEYLKNIVGSFSGIIDCIISCDTLGKKELFKKYWDENQTVEAFFQEPESDIAREKRKKEIKALLEGSENSDFFEIIKKEIDAIFEEKEGEREREVVENI